MGRITQADTLSAMETSATTVTVPLDMIQEIDSIQSSIHSVPAPTEALADPDRCFRNSFLSPLNLRVNEYNNTILDLLPGEGCTRAVKYFPIPLLTLP